MSSGGAPGGPDARLFRFDRFPDVRVLEDGRLRRLDAAQWRAGAAARAEFFAARLPGARAVALIGRTGTDLLLAWLGLLLAGKTPCLLQYPTAKLSRDYWEQSIRASLADCGLDAVVADDTVDPGADLGVAFAPLPRDLPPAARDWPEPEEGAIIQLSSGTTGVRKGIRFSLAALRRHALDYGAHLGLGPDEVMVSWLPLYHDMGFVTAWIMPLALGCATVLADPMDWVRRPGLFFDLVARCGGTRSYQPNFALEVLARSYGGQDLATLREVTACSEPTRAGTLERFARATGLPPARLSNCYAMAENVFAVSHGRNPRRLADDGRELVGCGRPAPGVAVKVVDGQLWVKSPTSLRGYVDGRDITDAEGFYPTGDMGFLAGGEVFVQGRRGDVVIVGGEKHFLSDVDLAVARLRPESRGRVCAFAEDDPRLGTEAVRVLIERPDFWAGGPEAGALSRALAERTGLTALEAEFAPPGFITKTSSGKVNRRRTGRDYALARAGRGFEAGGSGAEAVFRQFPQLAAGGPVGRLLDSLGYLTLTLLLAEHGTSCSQEEDARDLLARLADGPGAGSGADDGLGEVLLIVSLCCYREDGFFTSAYLDGLSRALGVPVHFERHIVPRAEGLLSDLVFHDWFMPRVQDGRYDPFRAVMARIKQAGVILFGQTTELVHPRFVTYPVLAHDFRGDPAADALAMRWPGYFRNHHLLPRTLLTPFGFDPARVNGQLRDLCACLGAEMFRLAFIAEYADQTVDWEWRELTDYDDYMRASLDPARDRGALQAAFTAHLRGLSGLKLTRGPRRNRMFKHGAHFCGWPLQEALLARAERFCLPHRVIGVAGPECSAPELARRLRTQGKELVFLTDNAGDEVAFDAFLQTGYDESLRRNKPSLLLMDGPLARLARYARSPFPLPAAQLREFLEARPDGEDLRLAQELLDAHRPDGAAGSLAAARDLPAGRRLDAADVVPAGRAAPGLPAWCAAAAAGRTLRRAVAAGEPLTLADIAAG